VRNLCLRSENAAVDAPMLGISNAMREIVAILARVAKSSGTALITGESGVGKERVSRALHELRDPQGKKPFIAVNCGALTESLLEAELFGYEKGAFTGANREKKGYFEQADGGTLFLDEIGDMPLAMQVKLLRAIQERSIVRVGGEKPIPVNIRLVCATHQDLKKMVEQGKFREDLYYRVHVIHIPVPPLRERREDILWLAEKFLAEFAAESQVRHSFLPAATQALADFSWPGTVRELRHCIERACILSPNPVLTAGDLFGQAPSSKPNEEAAAGSLTSHLRSTERHYIELALTAHQWRIKETAAALGITRKNLWEKMRKLEISAPEGDA
jgi:transcriptional regulator with PAS, ATPase and Fis domain